LGRCPENRAARYRPRRSSTCASCAPRSVRRRNALERLCRCGAPRPRASPWPAPTAFVLAAPLAYGDPPRRATRAPPRAVAQGVGAVARGGGRGARTAERQRERDLLTRGLPRSRRRRRGARGVRGAVLFRASRRAGPPTTPDPPRKSPSPPRGRGDGAKGLRRVWSAPLSGVAASPRGEDRDGARDGKRGV